MRIANADKLKEHFEHVVMVKNFTVPEILTIIDTFSSEVDENDIISRNKAKEMIKGWKNMDDYYHDADCVDIPIEEAYDMIDQTPSAKLGGTEP